MDNFKLFTIILDGKPIANMPVYYQNTASQIKSHLMNMYPNTSLVIYLDSIHILNDDSISSHWNSIVDGMLSLKSLSLTSFIKQPLVTKGEIRIRNVERGVSYPTVKNFKNIPAWSRGASPWKQLSPFFIGPVVFEENGINQAPIFENFWQSFKVWSNVVKQNTKTWQWPAEIHVGPDENPNANWYKWHNTLLKHNLPVRRPNGKNVPLYAWWKGRKLNIIESRKEIYIPYLQHLYRNHPVYQSILNDVRNGINIIILEPDGPPHSLYPDGMTVDLNLLYNLQNATKIRDLPNGDRAENPNKYFAYGHGMVIALTLLEDLNN